MSHPSIPTGVRRQPAPACRIGLAVLLGSAFLPFEAAAHEGETPVHYVAESGEDAGSCDHPSTPCRTIEYALTKADKGDEVLVAEGSYQFYPEDPAEVVMLLSPIVTVRGGYSAEDDFARQTPGDNPTVLIGPDQSRAPDLRSRGFVLQAQARGPSRRAAARAVLAALGSPRYVAPDGQRQGDCTDPEQAVRAELRADAAARRRFAADRLGLLRRAAGGDGRSAAARHHAARRLRRGGELRPRGPRGRAVLRDRAPRTSCATSWRRAA